MDSDSFSNCTKDQAAHARKPLIIPVAMRVNVKIFFFELVGIKLKRHRLKYVYFDRSLDWHPKTQSIIPIVLKEYPPKRVLDEKHSWKAFARRKGLS